MADLVTAEGEAMRGHIADEDIVSHPRRIIGSTLESILRDQGKVMPAAIAEHLDRYDYFVFNFRLGAKLPPQYKGVDSIAMDFDFVADDVFEIIDGLPKSEWVSSGLNIDIDVAITYNAGLKFVPVRELPNPNGGGGGALPVDPKHGIDTGIRFKFSIAPQIQTIRPLFNGGSCQLILRAKLGKSVDSQDISLIVATRKGLETAKLVLKTFRVKYRRDPIFTDTVSLSKPMSFDVEFRRQAKKDRL